MMKIALFFIEQKTPLTVRSVNVITLTDNTAIFTHINASTLKCDK